MSNMSKMLTKTFKAEASDTGEIESLIATFGVEDSDGDVTLRGFFGEQHVAIVESHDWGQVQIGKGVVTETDKGAVFAGKLNLEDPDGLKTHRKLKFDTENPPPLIEWSYGYMIHDGGSKRGEHEGRDVRFLQPLADGTAGGDVAEVSPVLRGAGVGTGTTSVKSEKRDPDLVTTMLTGMKFTDHVIQVRHEIAEAISRVRAVHLGRTEKAKSDFGDGQRLQLEAFAADLEEAAAEVKSLLHPSMPETVDFTDLEYEALVTSNLNRLRGAT